MSRKAKQTQPRRFLSSREPDQTPLQVSTPIMAFFASQPQPTPAPLEVRCAGCGETLEVERGLTQFVCPDCHTAQALPPELMPRKRKALPLTHPNPIQLSCGGCGVLLTLPPPSGLGTTFACPRCGAALALPLDHHQFRAYQASVDTSSPSTPSAVRLPPPMLPMEPQIRFPSYGGVNRAAAPTLTPVPSTTHANANAAFFQTNTTTPPSVSPVPPRNGTKAAIRPTTSPSSSRNETTAAIRPTISPVQPRNATNATIYPTTFPVPPLTETNTGIRPTNSSVPPCNEAGTVIPPKSTPVRPCVQTNTRKRQRITARQQDSLPAPSIPPSVNVEQVEKEVGPTPPLTNIPTSKRSKRAKKQPAVLTTSVPSSDDEEPLLRRSTRLANLPAKRYKRKKAPISKKKKQKPGTSLLDKSVPGQSEHNVSHQEPAPQDVAMHDNDLFSADSGEPLTDAFRQHLDTLVNLSSSLYVRSNLRSKSPVHPGSGLHVQPDQTSEPHLSPALDHTVSGQHRDQSPNDYTGQVDALSNDEGDDMDDAEEYYSHSDPEYELAGLQTLGAHNRNGANPGTHRKGRRRIQHVDLWSSSDNDPVEIKFNHLGQPVGKEATMLTRLLCTISRDGRLAPLNFTDWRAVPNDCKITIWSLVKSKFKVEEINKKIIMRALGRHWNRWKYTLKQLHYDTHDNDEERLADIDERIQPEQWPFLVQFWSSEEFQKRSAVGKASRSSMKMLHTTGSKSFAQIREEERLKRPNKEEPSRAEMFILTHTRKDGTPIDEEAAIIIARLHEELKNAPDPNNTDAQDDILAKVLREMNNPSLLSCYGLLPQDPRHARKPDLTEPSNEDKARIIAEARRLADEETKPMREKMDEMAKRHEEMEQRHKEMVEEMNRMRSTMMTMQQLVAARDNMGSV